MKRKHKKKKRLKLTFNIGGEPVIVSEKLNFKSWLVKTESCPK